MACSSSTRSRSSLAGLRPAPSGPAATRRRGQGREQAPCPTRRFCNRSGPPPGPEARAWQAGQGACRCYQTVVFYHGDAAARCPGQAPLSDHRRAGRLPRRRGPCGPAGAHSLRPATPHRLPRLRGPGAHPRARRPRRPGGGVRNPQEAPPRCLQAVPVPSGLAFLPGPASWPFFTASRLLGLWQWTTMERTPCGSPGTGGC
jgi:hypothetical protein